MKYAIVSLGGRQFKVSENEVVVVDKLQAEKDSVYFFPHVLLYVEENSAMVGKPFLSDIEVKGRILEHAKKQKIRVATFKAKSRYRRVKGFRQEISKIKIESIGLKEKKKEEEKTNAKSTIGKKVRRTSKKPS